MSLRLLFSFLLLPVIGHAETVTIGTEARFPPIVFIDGTGTLTGRDKEIGTEICDRAGLTCEWVITEFEALIPGVAAGRFDMAIAGIAATPERARSVDFTDPYQPPRQNLSLFVGTEGGIVPADALIAVQSGTTHDAHLQAQGLETAGYPDNVAALNAMIDGRTDLFFGTACSCAAWSMTATTRWLQTASRRSQAGAPRSRWPRGAMACANASTRSSPICGRTARLTCCTRNGPSTRPIHEKRPEPT